MEIKVYRQKSSLDWTLSTFKSLCGKISGVGIEDEKRTVKVHGETRIDAGIYNLSLTDSPKFSKEYYRDEFGNLILAKDRVNEELKQKYKWPHELITVENVKNFTRVLWHWGNTDDDTDACYLVGCVFGWIKKQAAVLNSRKKYTEIYPIIWRAIKAGKVTVEYIDNE
jgi:hypothetical protein